MSIQARDRKAAEFLLRESGLTLAECVRLVLDGLDALPRGLERGERLRTLRECMRLGVEAWSRRGESVTFGEAVERLLVIKAGRSRRTVQDIRQCLRKLGEGEDGWKGRLLGSITRRECAHRLEELFPSPSRRVKARAVLVGLFNEGIRREWCRENPARWVEVPRIREREICALQRPEIERLLGAAKRYRKGVCLPAVGLMLYAGIRPQETARLRWSDIDLAEGEIIVPARHSKTGGGRHVPICPALRAILEGAQAAVGAAPEARICPGNWVRKWRSVRLSAGFGLWQQDVLRHTFASYFAKCYRDLNALQLFMGHGNLNLLRTRYVNLRGVSAEDAHRFWHDHAGGRYESRRWYEASACIRLA